MQKIRPLIKDLTIDFDKDERKEIIQNMIDDKIDFEVSNYRFIYKNSIDEIMKDELLSDTYILGCCNAWFIAEITEIDHDIIEKAQKAENFVLLGELMAKNIEEVQEKMVQYDGYGHHFGHYDGRENETEEYYYFRVN